MDIRQRILAAAARVYAQHGFRGATTRLIATEAGVNEVTLFRTFGSKAALFDELTRGFGAAPVAATLPEVPENPERELTEWAAATLAQLRAARSFLRKSFGDIEERPDAARSACRGPSHASQMLTAYVARLQKHGLADRDADVPTAVAMLLSVFFGDAMRRDVMPHAFPEPAAGAPRRYVRVFLRAVGARVERKRATAHRALH